MALEITGRLIKVDQPQQVTDKFIKRDFVLDISETHNGQTYENFAPFQLTGNRVSAIDGVPLGSMVKVSFNVRGRKTNSNGVERYFVNMDAWKVDVVGQAQPQGAPQGYAQPAPQQAYSQPAPQQQYAQPAPAQHQAYQQPAQPQYAQPAPQYQQQPQQFTQPAGGFGDNGGLPF